ncbi:hypothetical protein EVAR_16852_1 [Eumeta japonica]|uniref:Uncharacterized protein n=1 Tax=Eumeta variegata TaxID=151549 RepID=A0A4C1V2F1_EUMVA|nr:hypothetical protein EVAR_16852_1 [Eumeta japonica]
MRPPAVEEFCGIFLNFTIDATRTRSPYERNVARSVKRLTLLWRGNRKRQSESECVALERMRVVYLLRASASVSDE